MIISRKSVFSIIWTNCDRSDIIVDLQKLNMCWDLNCRHSNTCVVWMRTKKQETAEHFWDFPTFVWEIKINWVTWVLVLIFCKFWFFSAKFNCYHQSNNPMARHTLLPGAHSEHSTLSVSLSSNQNHRPLTVPWGMPTCTWDAHDLLEAMPFQFCTHNKKKMQSHSLWVDNRSNLNFNWPGHNWSAVTQEAFTLKAAINIHCCRWVYIKITHWSMNADCGSNTSVTSVQWASNKTAE